MSDWMNHRTVTAKDMAHFFDISPARMERLLLRHRIDPLFRAGRVRLYGPQQVRAVNALLNG